VNEVVSNKIGVLPGRKFYSNDRQADYFEGETDVRDKWKL
jgi:hypothetical protein